MTLFTEKEQIVPDDFYGRLDRFLRRFFAHLPQSILEKYLRKGDVRVNKQKTQSDYRLEPGDVVTYPELFETFTPPTEGRIKDAFLHEKFKECIIYENDEFCVINKPYDIASQSGSKVKYSVDDMANAGANQYFMVHRLDKQTTGVMVMAKNAVTANVFMHQFREKKIQKYYIALLHQQPEYDSGVIDLPLLDGDSVMVDMYDGKPAVTRYRIIKEEQGYYWVLLKPYTGRKHQLRVHMKEGLNLPIVGDSKYRGVAAERMFLHAYKIKIPVKDGFLTVCCVE